MEKVKKYTLIFSSLLLVFAIACKRDTADTGETTETATAKADSLSPTGRMAVRSGMVRYASQRAGLRFSYPIGSTVMDNGNTIKVAFPPAPDSLCTPSSMQVIVEEGCKALAFSENDGVSVTSDDGKEKFNLYEYIKGYGLHDGNAFYAYKALQGGKCFTLIFFGDCPLEREGVMEASIAHDIVRTFRVGG